MKKREGKWIALLVSAIIVITAMASVAVADDWQQFQKDEVNIGWTTDDAPVAGPNVTDRTYLEGCGWSGIDAAPIVVDDVGGNPALDMVYVHTCGGNAWARHKGNGTGKWTMPTSGGGFQVGNPAYGNNKLFVLTANGHLFIFNAATGAQLNDITVCAGQLNAHATYYKDPSESEGMVFFGAWSNPTKYYCYWENGTERWNRASTSGGGYYWAGAAVIGDYLVYGDDGGNLTSVYWCNGTTVDEIDVSALYGVTANEIRSAVTWNETYGRIYFTSKGGYCYALGFNENTGIFNTADRWHHDIGYSTSTPVVYNERVYVGNNNGFSSGDLYCLDESDGSGIWNDPVGPVQSSPALSIQDSDVYIYVTTNCANGKLFCVKDDGNTPDRKWSYVAGTYVLQGAAISDEKVYFGDDGGYLHIIDEAPTKPDLTVTAIDNEIIYKDTYNIITATVENVGNGSAGSFNVTLDDGSGVVDDVSVPGINAGEETQVKLLWTPTTTSTYTLTVAADSCSVINEWNENNNTMQKAGLTPINIPMTDLVVSEVCDGNLINETDNEVFAVIRNDGTDASGFSVSLVIGGAEIDKEFVPTLHFRDSQLVTLNWTPTSVGNVQLDVTVDCDGQIVESNEVNNMTSQNVDVVTRVTRTVNPGGSIQDAIDDADPYDIIRVNDGTYNETVTIPAIKPGIKLIATGSNAVICNNTGDIVTIEGRNCKVQGFAINGSWGGAGWSDYPGACINVTSRWNAIKDNYIYNRSVGIKLYNSTNLVKCNTVGDSAEGRACLNLMAISGDCNAIVKNKFDGDTGYHADYGWVLGGIVTSAGMVKKPARWNLVINNNFTVTGVQGSIQFWYPGNVKFGGCRWGPNAVFNNVINDTDASRIRLDRLNWYDVGKVQVVEVANPMCGNVVHGPYYGGNHWSAYAGSDNNQDLLGDTLLPHMGYDNHPLIRAICGDVNCDYLVDTEDIDYLNEKVTHPSTTTLVCCRCECE